MGSALGATSVFLYFKNGIASMILMSMFQVTYQTTINPVHWIYLPEVLSDVQWGFVLTVHYLGNVEIALVSEYMFEYWRPEGTFLFYSLITLLGTFFYTYCVKETVGLSDK